MTKDALLDEIRLMLRQRLERLANAASESRAAATDPGSKAEGKYDTRSLEASYLSAGQARMAGELAETVGLFENLTLPDFEMEDAIDAGALVETDLDGETIHYLLAPAGGGLVVPMEGADVTLLAPASALYQKMLGMRVGESLENPPLMVMEVC